jgi:hypothetical protein
VNRVPIIFTD